jgi:hypothetical protein
MLDKKTFKHILTLGKRAQKIHKEIDEVTESLDVLDRFFAIDFVFSIDQWVLAQVKELTDYKVIYVVETSSDGWYEFKIDIDGVELMGLCDGKHKDDLLR